MRVVAAMLTNSCRPLAQYRASYVLQPAKPLTRSALKSAPAYRSSGTIVRLPATSYERRTQLVAWISPPDPSAVSEAAPAALEHAATRSVTPPRAENSR